MSGFFRNIRTSLGSRKSSSRDTTPVRSRPGSVISSRRDSTTSSTLQRGDTFIMHESEQEEPHSNSSTLEKKSKKSKVFSKFSTFTKRKKTPPQPEQVASYEHHPSDTATNTYYKWRSDNDRLLDYDAQADPFNFLYERSQGLDAMQRQPSLGSNSSGSIDSSTYRKSKTPTQLHEQLAQLKHHSKSDLLEEQDEREKYKTVTLSSFRKSFRDRLLQQQQQAPHNPAWFVEVPPPPPAAAKQNYSKENRPDFLVFENENYRPQSRSPLRERPSRSTTRSPPKRNETFRVARHQSPSPRPAPAPSIRIEIKNSILPHATGRLVPVGVAKPMPTTEYYAQRLLASQQPRPAAAHKSPMRQQQISSGRYQTLVHIGSDTNSKSPVRPSRALPTRVQLYGNKPSSQRAAPAASGRSATYFGGHYNAPHVLAASCALPAKHAAHASRFAPSTAAAGGGSVGVNWGRRVEQPATTRATAVAAAPRRNRSPIKIPWR